MPTLVLALIGAAVFQNGDTLFFSVPGRAADTLLLTQKTEMADSAEVVVTEKARVAPDSGHYFVYTERYFRRIDSIATSLKLYDADRKLLAHEARTGDEKISFSLTKIFDGFLALCVTGKVDIRPGLVFIDFKTMRPREIIPRGQWPAILKYELSPDFRYLALQARKRQGNQVVDYIYSRDLQVGTDWSYLFPTCLSCKRGVLNLKVDNNGRVDAEYKKEHRIFSNAGNLIDFYIENEAKK
jgi:hypothetical protein